MNTVYKPYTLTIFNVQPASHSKWSCSSALVSLDWSKKHPKTWKENAHTQTHTHTCSQCSQCISCFQVLLYCLFFSNAESTCALTLNPVAVSMVFYVFFFLFFLRCISTPGRHKKVWHACCSTPCRRWNSSGTAASEGDNGIQRAENSTIWKTLAWNIMKLQKRSSKNQTHHQMLDFRLQEKRAEAFIWRGETTTPQSFQAS